MQDDALHTLIEQGHFDELDRIDPALLRAWRSRKRDNTLLHHAARHGAHAEKLLAVLLRSGLDVNVRNSLGQTPVMTIFERPEEQTMDWLRALTDAGARLDLYPGNGQGFVYQCASHRRWDALAYAAQQGVVRHDDRVPWEGSPEHALLLQYQQMRRGKTADTVPGWFEALDRIFPPGPSDRNRAFLLALRMETRSNAVYFFNQGVDLTAMDDQGNTVPHLVASCARYRGSLPAEFLSWMRQAVADGVDLRQRNNQQKSTHDLIAGAAQPEQVHALRQAVSEGEAMKLHSSVSLASRARTARRF